MSNIQLTGVIVGIVGLIAIGRFIFGVGRWVERVDRDRRSWRKLAEDIQKKLDKIFKRLKSRTVTSDSPLQLTELGRQLADRLEVQKWAEVAVAADELDKWVKGKEPYDIQDYCFEYVRADNRFTKAAQREMKMALYETGLREETEVLDIYAIVLRNKLLEVAGNLEAP